MTQLAPLRTRLNALRLARRAVRWGSALSQLVVALVAGWFVAYLLDRGLNLSWPGRVVVLAAWLMAIGWFAWRHMLPQMLDTESLEQLALAVEHRQGIDSDLVAALQFDAAPVGAWGSPRLSSAVVEYVAEFSPSLNVFEGFSWRPLPRRLIVAAIAALVAFALCVRHPDHAAAFWNRFWLGTAHYPTRTVIAKLAINGQQVPVYHAEPVRLRMAQGQPLQLQAEWSGEPPDAGAVRVHGLRTGSNATWTLKPGLAESRASIGEARRSEKPGLVSSAFHLEPQSLTEDVRLRVQLGDAVADAVEINVVPLPVVELRWMATSPRPRGTSDELAIPPGARQFAVRAGTQVSLRLECLNKSLKSAELVLPEGTVPLAQESPTEWTSPAGTALDHVLEPLTYEIQIIDEDGLSPEPRVTGQIRLRPDRPPRVAAAVISKKVLPTAKPRIAFGAADDYGIKQVSMTIEIIPPEGAPRRDERVIWTATGKRGAQTTVREEAVLNLSPYQLAKGDLVRVTLEADDDRGPAPSQHGQSEPLTFEITDRNGILSSLMETDQQSAKQLDAIILRELGIGGGKP